MFTEPRWVSGCKLALWLSVAALMLLVWAATMQAAFAPGAPAERGMVAMANGAFQLLAMYVTMRAVSFALEMMGRLSEGPGDGPREEARSMLRGGERR